MTTMHLHSDPTISAFLANGGYANIAEWMEDSDYRYEPISAEWYHVNDHPFIAEPVDPEDVISGAIEEAYVPLHLKPHAPNHLA